MNATSLFGGLMTDLLEVHGPLAPRLRQRLRQAVVRIVDSELIIENDCTSFANGPSEFTSQVTVSEELLRDIGGVVSLVEVDGLEPHFRLLMREFARAMFYLFSDAAQFEKVKAWFLDKHDSSFMMTDAGGPSLSNWKTCIRTVDGNQVLDVDKIWAMNADRLGFAIVAARTERNVFPTVLILSPEQCATLGRRANGRPFLGGSLQLGNVRGSVAVSASDRVAKGGPTMLNQLLTVVRPQLVRSLMSHVQWLDRQRRLTLSDEHHEAVANVKAIATSIASSGYSSQSASTALAVKFASNELLLDIACSAGPSEDDERDLLAFTKMEGSSYRCFREIYARARAYNQPRKVQPVPLAPDHPVLVSPPVHLERESA